MCLGLACSSDLHDHWPIGIHTRAAGTAEVIDNGSAMARRQGMLQTYQSHEFGAKYRGAVCMLQVNGPCLPADSWSAAHAGHTRPQWRRCAGVSHCCCSSCWAGGAPTPCGGAAADSRGLLCQGGWGWSRLEWGCGGPGTASLCCSTVQMLWQHRGMHIVLLCITHARSQHHSVAEQLAMPCSALE